MDGKRHDLADLVDKWRRYPSVWPSIQADTWIWCLHCERCFQFIDVRVDDDGLVTCPYYPDCDASALDFWPWSPEDWAETMGGQDRPAHWPVEPERHVPYPLYP